MAPRDEPLVADQVEGEEGVFLDTAEADLTALGEVDRQNRVGRTVLQAGIGGACVTVTEYVLAYFDADLDPWADGYQDHFPPVFTGAVFVIFTTLAAVVMNRRR